MPEKFQLKSTTRFTWGHDKRFSKFLSAIVNNYIFIEIQPNFNAKWELYSIANLWCKIGVIQSRGRLFLYGLMSVVKKKFGQLFECTKL